MFWKKWFRKTETVPSPYGPLSSTRFEVKPVPQTLRSLKPEEDAARAGFVARAETLAREQGIQRSPGGGRLNPDELDELLKRWNPPTASVEEFNLVAQVLGFAFGDYLVERHRLRWVVLSDEHGTDFAVTDEAGDFTAFPISTVGKRLDSGERDFLGPVAFTIQRQVTQVRQVRKE